MKCIVIETSAERIAAKPVTNEDETPHIYATISEARAELKANGYAYNRTNQRYYIKGTEYRAYIVREDSNEYDEIMEQAEEEAAPEYIEPEHIQTVSGHKIYRSIDPVTGWNVFSVAGRDFWELAEARYFAQCNPADVTAEQRATVAAMVESIAGQPVDYLHRHTINLGTSRYPDHRPEYEQYHADTLILHGTASKSGKSIDKLSISYAVLVLN